MRCTSINEIEFRLSIGLWRLFLNLKFRCSNINQVEAFHLNWWIENRKIVKTQLFSWNCSCLSCSSHIFVFWFLVDSYQKTKISAVLQCYLKKDQARFRFFGKINKLDSWYFGNTKRQKYEMNRTYISIYSGWFGFMFVPLCRQFY